jgi:hypothetical protein
MLFVSTVEDRANPLGELVSSEQPLGLDYLAFAVDPLRLYCVEPRALGGQQARHYPDPMAAGFDLAVVGGDPAPHLSAFVPRGVVPDKKQNLLVPPPPCPSVGARGSTTQETVWLWHSPGGRPRTSASSLRAPADKARNRRGPSARDRPFSPLSQGGAPAS